MRERKRERERGEREREEKKRERERREKRDRCVEGLGESGLPVETLNTRKQFKWLPGGPFISQRAVIVVLFDLTH